MPDYQQTLFRDRDVFHDSEGRVYVTLGYIQPTDRVLSYLKYIPAQEGKWKSSQNRYTRIFSGGIDSVVDGSLLVPKNYIFHDPYFGAELLEVPKSEIASYFFPEEKLREIIDNGPKDTLEAKIVTLTQAISSTLHISLSNLGVTGSVAWGAHDPEWSDININIYGFRESWSLYNNYDQVAECSSDIRLRRGDDWASTMSHLKSRVHHLSQGDLLTLYSRRTELILEKYYPTIMPVLLPHESPIEYGSEQYITMTDAPIDIEMGIDSCEYGIFHPAIYTGHSEPVKHLDNIEVTRIMMYDGSFRGMLREGDAVHVRGTVQRVIYNNRPIDDRYQIMVGTKQGIGNEFVRIIE